MEIYRVENLTFSYPNVKKEALLDINFSVFSGEFVTVCGKSGCGKTTLLRLLKTSLAPYGELKGNIFFKNKPIADSDMRIQSAEIGFVMQNPDNQIVTDKVWHELAFGLESLGYENNEIRTRVAEMASFFGIEEWFHKKVTELSGGQKQLLNLASIMVMQPSVLILDEPTSQLDPIAAQEFLRTLEKINRELGTTVIMTEHRLEDAFSISDRVIVMDSGKIIADSEPKKVGKILKNTDHDMYKALPVPMRVWSSVENSLECPLTVREGKIWLSEYSKDNRLMPELIPASATEKIDNTVIEIKDVWFRYEKNLPDVIKGLNLKINSGELFAVMGGNGTGKTTALSLISRLNKPYRGEIRIKGEKISDIRSLYDILGVLPQNPQALFVKKTVYLDLLEILPENLTEEEKNNKISEISLLCRIEGLLENHPYDLSGGEQQRAALAKVLLKEPEILLLDEPTKGMDASFKECFADILSDLKVNGVTIVMVSHDIDFCAEYADRCAMFFDGNIVGEDEPRAFFAGKSFYTTAANRMARTMLPKAILSEDIILACGGKINERKRKPDAVKKQKLDISKTEQKKLTPKRVGFGSLFVLMYALTCLFLYDNPIFELIVSVEILFSFICFFPKKEFQVKNVTGRKLTKRTIASLLFILTAVPLTIYIGTYCFESKKYYFISLLIILETLIPFGFVFESRKPQARELIVISVLCAIAVAGRGAFFMSPQFKPVISLVIIAGICFGGETGFLVGAVTGFVSNFFFGQGPWTPWQMFSFGIIGFLAGILFKKNLIGKNRVSLCIFGFLATLLIYGGIMNPASVIMWQPTPTIEMIISAYAVGIPFDLIHASGTAFFLWFISVPMIEKLERIKIKYGLYN